MSRPYTPLVTEILRGLRIIMATRPEAYPAALAGLREMERSDTQAWRLNDGQWLTRRMLAELLRRI